MNLNFFNHFKKIRLNAEERTKIRVSLIDYLDKNPVRSPDTNRHVWQRSRIFSLFLTRKGALNMPALIIALIITLSGGISAGANNSLPGDLLYPVKVSINERVKAAVAVSSESEADLALKLMDERLQETEQLATKSDLKAELVAQVDERFTVQADKLKDLIGKFEAEGKTEVVAKLTANLSALLRVHDQVLSQLREKLANIDPANIDKIQAKIKAEIKNADDINVRVETKVKNDADNATSTEPSTEHPRIEAAAKAKLEAAQHKIAEVDRFLNAQKDRVTEESWNRANAKLGEAKNLVAQGKVKLEAKAYAEAFRLFQQAHITAQSAKLHLVIEHRLEINIPDRRDDNDRKRDEKKEENKNENSDEDNRDNNDNKIDLKLKLNNDIKLEVR